MINRNVIITETLCWNKMLNLQSNFWTQVKHTSDRHVAFGDNLGQQWVGLVQLAPQDMHGLVDWRPDDQPQGCVVFEPTLLHRSCNDAPAVWIPTLPLQLGVKQRHAPLRQPWILHVGNRDVGVAVGIREHEVVSPAEHKPNINNI